MEDDIINLNTEAEFNFSKIKKGNIKKIKADLYAILKNSTSQLHPGNLTNTTTKNILAQFKKSSLFGCDIIVS